MSAPPEKTQREKFERRCRYVSRPLIKVEPRDLMTRFHGVFAPYKPSCAQR
jgi:hypothetical protein